MRQRKTFNGSGEQGGGLGRSILKTVRRVDFYPKYDSEEVKSTKTTSGAIISILTAAIILWLLVSETSRFMKTIKKEHVTVDSDMNLEIAAFLNISFHHLKCESINIVNQDVSGESIETNRTMLKLIPLSASGIPINISKSEGTSHIRRDAGCRLQGHLNLKKVSGNFHIAAGELTRTPDGRVIHRISIAKAKTFRPDHTIHALRFGPLFKGMNNTLDGYTAKFDGTIAGHFQYNIKIVPTTYSSLGGDEVYSAQYSATMQKSPVVIKPGSVHIIPGVFFSYAISAYMVSITESRQAVGSFLTSISAIIGGTFTIAGIVSSLMYHGGKALRLFTLRPGGGSSVAMASMRMG